MKRHEEELLNQALEAVRTDAPDPEAMHASAARISDRLGIAMKEDVAVHPIRSCNDIRELLDAYRHGTLPEARSLLVKAHLSDCGACLRYFRQGERAAKLDWSTPGARPSHRPSSPDAALGTRFFLRSGVERRLRLQGILAGPARRPR